MTDIVAAIVLTTLGVVVPGVLILARTRAGVRRGGAPDAVTGSARLARARCPGRGRLGYAGQWPLLLATSASCWPTAGGARRILGRAPSNDTGSATSEKSSPGTGWIMSRAAA